MSWTMMGEVLAGPECVAGVEQHPDSGPSTASARGASRHRRWPASRAACTPRPAPCQGRRRALRSPGTRTPSWAMPAPRVPRWRVSAPATAQGSGSRTPAMRSGGLDGLLDREPRGRVVPKSTVRPARGWHGVEDCADRQWWRSASDRYVATRSSARVCSAGSIHAQLDAIEAELAARGPDVLSRALLGPVVPVSVQQPRYHATVPSAGTTHVCAAGRRSRSDWPGLVHEAGWRGELERDVLGCAQTRTCVPRYIARSMVTSMGFSPSPTSMASWRMTRMPAPSGC